MRKVLELENMQHQKVTTTKRWKILRDSLIVDLGGEVGSAGFGGTVQQGLPILDGGLSLDALESDMLEYSLPHSLLCNTETQEGGIDTCI